MKLESFSASKKHNPEQEDVRVQDSSDVSEEIVSGLPEHVNPVFDQEVRKFTKEHALSFRNALAQVLWARRKSYRDERPTKREQLTDEFENLKTSLEADIDALEKDLQKAREALSEREQEKEIWDEVNREAEELRMELDKMNSSLWHRALNYIDGRIDKKSQSYQEIDTQINGEFDTSTYNYISDGLPKTEEVHVRIAQDDVMRADRKLVDSGSYLKENLDSAYERFIKEMRNYVHDDDWVEKGKAMVRDFYRRNADLKESIEANPELRDVTELSKQHGVLFVHGFPIHDYHAENNNNHVINNHRKAEGRLELLAALSPAISCSTFTPNFSGEKDEIEQRIWSRFGVILSGGITASASPDDNATIAGDFDSRASKRKVYPNWDSLRDQVSDFEDNETFSKNLHETIRGRRLREEYADSAEGLYMSGRYLRHNEVVVKNPKIATLYVRGSEYVRGTQEMLQKKSVYEGVFNEELKYMLEKAETLGVPLVYIDLNDQITNILTGEPIISVDEFVDNPVSFSQEERFSLLDQAGISFQGKQLHEVTNRIESFSTPDDTTKRARDSIQEAVDRRIRDLNLDEVRDIT